MRRIVGWTCIILALGLFCAVTGPAGVFVVVIVALAFVAAEMLA